MEYENFIKLHMAPTELVKHFKSCAKYTYYYFPTVTSSAQFCVGGVLNIHNPAANEHY